MKCIYCLQEDGVTFRGVEHVLPQAFGTYGSKTPTLGCVCDKCNSHFGRELDQILARDTLEGISRYVHGLRSSESRPQKRLNITLAEDPAAGDLAGLKVDVDGRTGMLMRPRAQFHAFNFKAGENEIYFREQIGELTLPETVYGKPGKDGVAGTWRVKIFAASKEEHDELAEALRAAGIDYKAGNPFPTPPMMDSAAEELSLKVVAVGVVDNLHKRALAKIFMNFIAWGLGYNEALKPRWDFLRRYVRHAEGEMKSRISEEPFWTGHETKSQRFVGDSIDIRLENLDGHIVGSIQFYGRYTYQLILAENDALPAGAEIGYRFTPGSEPILGEKRPTQPRQF